MGRIRPISPIRAIRSKSKSKSKIKITIKSETGNIIAFPASHIMKLAASVVGEAYPGGDH